MSSAGYVGRFAPSPTGPLHAGSLVAALASWLDARAHGGRWLVRIEDIDTPRCVPGTDTLILHQLSRCGLVSDARVEWQSQRQQHYADAIEQLSARAAVYPCQCSRRQIAAHWQALGLTKERHAEWPYPGSCSHLPAEALDPTRPHALRLRCGDALAPVVIDWQDRRLGPQAQNLTTCVGDMVLRRADGLWAYQLAVVVDDAAQGVSDVVRGEDLADNTPRQIHLQRQLGLPTPRYLHTPLVLGADGQKLSKQNGAQALDTQRPLAALQAAGQVLGLQVPGDNPADWLAAAVLRWRNVWQSR